jgi:hypothetical protein
MMPHQYQSHQKVSLMNNNNNTGSFFNKPIITNNSKNKINL